jgi:hypothetical protein
MPTGNALALRDRLRNGLDHDPTELLQRTSTASLDDAFIALMPEEERRDHRAIVIPPLRDESQADIAIETVDLTKRFGDFTADDLTIRDRPRHGYR